MSRLSKKSTELNQFTKQYTNKKHKGAQSRTSSETENKIIYANVTIIYASSFWYSLSKLLICLLSCMCKIKCKFVIFYAIWSRNGHKVIGFYLLMAFTIPSNNNQLENKADPFTGLTGRKCQSHTTKICNTFSVGGSCGSPITTKVFLTRRKTKHSVVSGDELLVWCTVIK